MRLRKQLSRRRNHRHELEPLEIRRLLSAEVAASADSFVNSIGVNIHAPINSTVTNLVASLGVRHVRENVGPGDTTNLTALSNLYTNDGVSSDMITSPSWNLSSTVSLAESAYIEDIEGPNEPDLQGTPYSYGGHTDNPASNSYPGTIAYQNVLYTALKNDSKTSSKPVLSPSLANTQDAQYFQSASFDVENFHHYVWSMPATGISSAISDTHWLTSSGNTTVGEMETETGYFTYTSTWDPSGDQSGTDNATQAKYLPEALADNFNAGVQRTYLYDLMDDPISGTETYENHFGLTYSNGTVKPAYTDIQNMISLLSDSTWNTGTDTWDTPSFTPGALDYTITGDTSNLEHTLLEKSDGTFYLLLWQNAASYNFSTQQDITNPTVSVTLNLNTPVGKVQTYLLNSTTATGTYYNPQSLTLNVPDQIMVVELPPRAIDAPWTDTDIGSVGVAGSDSEDGGTFTISGSGTDIWGTADAFNYMYQSTTGNGSIDARVVSVGDSDAWAKSGVMYRNGTGDDAMYAAVLATPSNGVVFQWRSSTGGTSSSAQVTGITTPVWLKLSRSGNSFSAYYSSDDVNWTQIGSTETVAMASAADVGLAVTAVNNSELSTSVFDSVYLSSPTVTITATTATTNESGGSPGVFTVTRTGSTTNSLTVDYTVGGTAASGSDYDALSGSVVIPAGSTFATINVTPINDSLPEVDENVVVMLSNNSNYNIGPHWNDAVTIINDDPVDNFEEGNLSSWSVQNSSISNLSLTTSKVDSGTYAMEWMFHDTSQWGNQIQMKFSAQDWTNATAVQIRFAVDPASIGDAGKTIYFNYYNNSTSPTGSSAEDSFHIEPTSAYQTVTLTLGPYTRNEVNEIAFFVDGSTYTANSTNYFYIDNITLIKPTVTLSTSRTLADLNNGNVSAWSSSTRSNVTLSSTVVDTGPYALKWTYNDDGATQWNNEIFLNLPAQDWTNATDIVLRFAVDPANAASDAGKTIYMDYVDNGSRVSGGSGAASFEISSSITFETIDLSLGSYSRSNVTQLLFYVNGNSYATGNHIFYLDNITLISKPQTGSMITPDFTVLAANMSSGTDSSNANSAATLSSTSSGLSLTSANADQTADSLNDSPTGGETAMPAPDASTRIPHLSWPGGRELLLNLPFGISNLLGNGTLDTSSSLQLYPLSDDLALSALRMNSSWLRLLPTS